MTPELQRLYDAVHGVFPDVGSMGITNCRKIAGSETWSQHAWSNAWDITSPAELRASGLSDEHYAYLDSVSEFLDLGDFPIRFKLWRRTNHYDHIHVDLFPYGYGTPPCSGGALQVKWEDGTITDSWEEPLAHEHNRGPLAKMHEWAEEAWDAYVEAGLTTVPESAIWEMYREDQAWFYLKAVKPLEAELAELRALLNEPA